MTDNTQELGDILNVLYMQGEDMGKLEYGSATHQITAVNGAKQAIQAYTNAEIAKVLDRLDGNKETLYWWTGGEYDKTIAVDMRAIAAEREQLNKLEAEL